MKLCLFLLRQLSKIIMAASMADRIDISFRDPLKVLCHHLRKVVAVHLHQGRRGFCLRLCQLLLAASEHLLHKPLGKRGVPAECHTVKPGVMNRKIRIQEESVPDRNTQRRTINQLDLSEALIKKEAFQRFIFLISTDIGSCFSLFRDRPDPVRCNDNRV